MTMPCVCVQCDDVCLAEVDDEDTKPTLCVECAQRGWFEECHERNDS